MKTAEAIKRVIEKLESGTLSPITKLAVINRMPGDIIPPSSKWTFSNQLMAFIFSGSLDCRGYKQWKEVNRHVKKGEKAAACILVPCMPKKDKDQTEEEGKKKARPMYFITRPVFADYQTDGEELEKFDYTPGEPPPLLTLAESLEIPVNWLPVTRNAYGSYMHNPNNGDEHINLHSEELEVWFHELGHALHNRLQLMDGETKVQKEVVAELVAAVLMDIYGIDNTGNAWRYISGYATNPLAAIKKALEDVTSIVDYIYKAA